MDYWSVILSSGILNYGQIPKKYWFWMKQYGQIFANRFVLKLKLKCNFSYRYPIIGHDVRRNCLCVGVTVEPWSASPSEYDPCRSRNRDNIWEVIFL